MKNTSYPSQAPAPTGPVVGVDVSKVHLDIACWPITALAITRFTNDANGHAQLVDALRALAPRLIVLEATGGYERDGAAALQRAAFTVAIVNPRPVRDFAKAHNILAKTDRLDAAVIARYGHDVEVRTLDPIDETRQIRADLVDRRSQLVGQRTAEMCRVEHARTPLVAASLKTHIEHLDQQIDDLDKQIRQLIECDDLAKAIADKLETTAGVGPGTSAAFVTRMPELGRVSRLTSAALVGIAPMNDDSGTHRGQRHIRGGRADLRAILYMATLTATRCNAVIRAHYQQLRARGKAFKVAIVACMRKLLTHLNNLARSVIEQRSNSTIST